VAVPSVPVDRLSSLLTRARDGDERALAEFVTVMYPPIWRFCAHLVGRLDAEDATQETFLAAWRALPQFRGEASARTWLFVIARRCADRMVQRRRRWVELADVMSPPASNLHPETATEIDQLLAGLQPDQRLAIVLTQVIGLSYAEAAAVCECPIGTIRSRVARARKELSEQRSWRPTEGLASS
jgi:RNA polymerase sigma-70 factor, ECF subfamily